MQYSFSRRESCRVGCLTAHFVRISKLCVHPPLLKYFFLSSLWFPRIFLSAIPGTFFRLAIILYDWGWNQGLTLFIRAPYRIERLFPVFKLLSLFCLDCILYDVGHKNPGMPLCSLNPYRSVQCYSWGTLWLFHGDNVSAFCVPTVLPCTLRREVFHIWLADFGILWVPLCSVVFCYWRVNIYTLVGRLMA